MEDRTSPFVSRRSFIGMLTILPAAVGGFLLPFDDEAQAEMLDVEADSGTGTQTGSNSTKIVVAMYDEIGIVVTDVANGQKKPVKGADVTLTSRSNGRQVSGTTDATGTVILKIDQLTEKEKDEYGGETYRGYAKMTVDCTGYRKFHTGCVSIEGGRGFMAPTRSVSAGAELAYPILATFDEWDILYTNNCFAVTRANDMVHTLRFEIATAMPRATVSLVSSEGKKLVSGEVTTTYTEGSVEFKELFLLRFGDKQLPIGQGFTLLIEGDRGSCSFPLAMEVTEAVGNTTAPDTSKVLLSPFWPAGNGAKPTITFPDGWGFLSGQKLTVNMPEAKFDFFRDPFGYVRIGYRSDEFGTESKYTRSIDGRESKPGEWKRHPRKSFQEQMQKAANDRDAMKKKVGTAIHSRTGAKVHNVEYTRKISGKLGFSCAAAGRWNQALWRMNAFAELLFSFNFSYSQQLIIGPVPAVFEYGVMMCASAAASFGLATPELFSPDKYTIDCGSSGISFTLVIAPSISFGVGIKGVLTASLMGSVCLTLCVAMRPVPPDGTGLTNPNIVIGVKLMIEVVVQALIFSKSFKVFSIGDAEFYNNWKKGLKTQSDDYYLLAQEETDDLSDFFDGSSIITDDELEDVVEFTGSGFDEEDGDENPFFVTESDEGDGESARLVSRQVEMVTEDGTAYPCTVVELVTRVSEDNLVAEGGLSGNADNTGPMMQDEGSDALLEQDAEGHVVGSAPYDSLRAQAVDVDEDGALLIPYVDEEGWYGAEDLGSFTSVEEGHYYAGLVDSDKESFSGVASNMGLVPSPDADMRIAKNVFSDPRAEILSVQGSTYLFRVATTKDSHGRVRSRIVYQRIDGGIAGPENVLDYRLGYKVDTGKLIKKSDLYVYDFDVAMIPAPGHSDISLVFFFIISGKRANGDKTTFGQVACDQVFTVAGFYFSKYGIRFSRAISNATDTAEFDAAGGGTDYAFHSFSCPHVEVIEDRLGNKTYPSFLLNYVDRAGRTPDEAVGKDARVGLGCCIVDCFMQRISCFNELMLRSIGNLGGGIYEMVCNRRVRVDDTSGWSLVMLRGHDGNNTVSRYVLIKSSAAYQEDTRYTYLPAVLMVSELPQETGGKPLDDPGNDFEALRLVDWPNHEGEFLCSKDGKLQRVMLMRIDTTAPKLGDFVPCGPDKFNINGFGVDPTGRIIYWPACGDSNPGYTYDSEGNGSENAGSPVNVILASCLHGSSFSDPFVYAEVKHDMQSVQVIEHFDPSKLALLSVDMTRADSGSADIWFTLIPRVKCANVIGCALASPFAYPGGSAEFELTVRNDGNTYLTGFTAELRLRGSDGIVSESRLVFSKDTILESSYNPMGSDGKLEGVEDDYSLAPGKLSVYVVKLDIPKDWANEKEVTVTVRDATIATGRSTSTYVAQSDDADWSVEIEESDVEEYIVDSDDWEYAHEPYEVLEIWDDDEVDDEWEEEYYDSPMTLIDPEGSGGSGNGGSGSNAGNAGNGGNPNSAAPSSGLFGQGGRSYGGPRTVSPYGGYAGPGSRSTSYTGPAGGGSGTSSGTSGVGVSTTGGPAGAVGDAVGAAPVAGSTYTGSAGAEATGGAHATSDSAQVVRGTAGTGVSSGASIPRTSDATTSAGVPLKLGLAGAAMLAYSRRRERLEQEGRGDRRAVHREDE